VDGTAMTVVLFGIALYVIFGAYLLARDDL
jgi:hypothetical protein